MKHHRVRVRFIQTELHRDNALAPLFLGRHIAPSGRKKRNVIVWIFFCSPSPSFDYPCENKPLSLPGKATLLLSHSHLHFSLPGPGQANAQEKDKLTQMLKRQWGCAVMQIYQSLNARVRIIFELNEALAF